MPESLKSILFVDDDADILASLRRLLRSKRSEWEMVFATSATEAEEMLAAGEFDVVVLDVKMPGRSGLDLLAEWRERSERPGFEIIMLTGLKDEELKRKSLELGATDLLNKPVARDDLIARLQNVLEMKTYRDSLQQRTRELEDEVERRRQVELQLKEAMAELEAALAHVQELSTIDPLTQLYNRRFFAEKLEEYWELSARLHQPLSCIIADLDHFKAVNDNYSHQAGDQVLQQVAQVLKETVRRTDIVARYGGEEFVVLLPNTKLADASFVAEKLRCAVEASPVAWESESLPVTASLGVAASDEADIENKKQLIAAADRSLYRAKEEGRNRVETRGRTLLCS